MSKLKNRNFIFFITEICVFFLTLAIHIYFVRHMEGPISGDECHTFMIGAFLSGRYDLSLLHAFEEQNMYYGFGQAIFYIPLFYLFDSFVVVYKVVLVLHSVVMSLIPVLALKCFRRLLSDCEEVQRVGMALAIGLFSPLIYFSKMVLNETFLLFIPVLILYILVLLSQNDSKKKKWILSAVLGFLGMYMYTLNARGLAITFSVCVCVFFMEVIRKEKKVALLPYGLATILVYGINHILKNYIIQTFYQPFSGAGAQNADFNLLQRLQNLITGNFITAFSSWCGNLLYVVVVSGGLLSLLFVVLFVKKRKDEETIILYAVGNTVITCAMLFFVNYGTNSNPTDRYLDYYISGRYYDLLIPVILIVGFVVLYQYRDVIKYHIIAEGLILISGGLSVALLTPILIRTGAKKIRIMNIGTFSAFLDDSFVDKPTYWHFIGVSIAILLFYGLVAWLAKKKKFLLLALLFSSCFLYAGAYVMEDYEESSLSRWNFFEQYRSIVSEYEQLDTSYKTIYYFYEGGNERSVNVQFVLDNWRVSQVDVNSTHNEDISMIAENSFILARKEMFLDIMIENCAFLCEQNGLYLYAYGEGLIEELNVENRDRGQLSLMAELSSGSDIISLIIGNGAHSFGPYIHLDSGTYYVEIKGLELETASVQVTRDMSTKEVRSRILEQGSEKISLLFTSDVSMDNIEISVYNLEQEYIIIDYMCVKNQRGEKIFETEGKNLRLTSPVDVTPIFIRGMEEMYLEPVILGEGRYYIRLEGINVNDLKLVCDEEGIQFEEMECQEDYIVYELRCDDLFKYPHIRIVSRIGTLKLIKSITIEGIIEAE